MLVPCVIHRPEKSIQNYSWRQKNGRAHAPSSALASGLYCQVDENLDAVQGLKPLQVAAQASHPELLHILLSHGADVNVFQDAQAGLYHS